MIFTGLIGTFYDTMLSLLQGMDFMSIPSNFITFVSTFLAYGSWIISPTLLALIFSCIVSWWSLKFGVGLFVFIWELLPLT